MEILLSVAGAIILMLLGVIAYFGKKTLEKSESTYDLVSKLKTQTEISQLTYKHDLKEIWTAIKKITEDFDNHIKVKHNEKS